jgi:hypothetical protein
MPDLAKLYDGKRYLDKLTTLREGAERKLTEEEVIRLPDSYVVCHKLRFDAESVCWGEPWLSVHDWIN